MLGHYQRRTESGELVEHVFKGGEHKDITCKNCGHSFESHTHSALTDIVGVTTTLAEVGKCGALPYCDCRKFEP